MTTITDQKRRKSYERRLKRQKSAVEEQRKRARAQREQEKQREAKAPPERTEVSGMIDIWATEAQPGGLGAPLEHTGGDADLEAGQSEALVDERRARRYADQGRWKDAYRAIRAALRTDPENPAINIFFAWVVYNLPHKDIVRQRRVCRSRIEIQLQLDNCNADGYYYMGKMFEDDRQFADALDYYRTAVALKRDHSLANAAFKRVQRHPALAESTQSSEETSGKIFGRLRALFGGKE